MVMGYHLSHGTEHSPAAVVHAELSQLWMRWCQPALALIIRSEEKKKAGFKHDCLRKKEPMDMPDDTGVCNIPQNI